MCGKPTDQHLGHPVDSAGTAQLARAAVHLPHSKKVHCKTSERHICLKPHRSPHRHVVCLCTALTREPKTVLGLLGRANLEDCVYTKKFDPAKLCVSRPFGVKLCKTNHCRTGKCTKGQKTFISYLKSALRKLE